MGSTTSRSKKFTFLTVALGAFAVVGLSVGLSACGKNKGKVHFGNLKDGAEVESPFTVEMKAENLIVEAATNGVRDGHGHFHILVNTPVPMSLDPIPKDAQHIHYGEGETEATLDLPVGEHTLILQFAKGDHRPYDPQITQEIRIRVTRQNIVPGTENGMPGDDGYPNSGGTGTGTGTGTETDDGTSANGSAADSMKAKTAPNTPVIVPGVGSGGMGGGGM